MMFGIYRCNRVPKTEHPIRIQATTFSTLWLMSLGNLLQIGVVSPLCALEFVRIHRAVLPSILATNFDGESRSVSNGGNNSYNRNNNGGGNRNAGNGQYNGNSNASSSASAAPDTRWDAPSANDDDDPSVAFDGLAF